MNFENSLVNDIVKLVYEIFSHQIGLRRGQFKELFIVSFIRLLGKDFGIFKSQVPYLFKFSLVPESTVLTSSNTLAITIVLFTK